MDSLESILKNRRFSSAQFAERMNQQRHEDVTRLEESLVNTIVNFKGEVDEMSKTYRPGVAQEKARERAEQILREMDSSPGSLLRQLGRRWATSRESLARKAGLGPSSDPAVVTREHWILDQLGKLNRADRLLALQRAVERGDAATVRAALNCPSTFQIVDDNTVEQIRQQYYTQHLPSEAAAYKAAYADHETEQENFATAERCIREIAGTTADLRGRLEQAQAQS